MQEFIELVRQGERLKAIQHSQEHLRSWAEVHPVEFQQVMCSLLFGQASEGNPYSSLFDQSQWSGIAELFYQELYRLHSMTQQSLLTIELQVILYYPKLSSEIRSLLVQLQGQACPERGGVRASLHIAVTADVLDCSSNGTIFFLSLNIYRHV